MCTSGVEAAAVATKSAEERVAGKSSEREDLMEKAAAARREIDAAKAAEKARKEREEQPARLTSVDGGGMDQAA